MPIPIVCVCVCVCVCPPQLVVVSNHDDGSNTASIFQGNDSISEPSSQGSEPELQIDLGLPSSGERRGVVETNTSE